jgi:UDP-3-O-[3-hydroxymyristoyl] N-acetylglucosamine deacetylase / 3-hydroxyacyl-[acyl-carrier-protein] dehydratase
MLERQATVAREVKLAGPGLFSGEAVELTFAPAPPDHGITFLRQQDGHEAQIPATVASLTHELRRTALRSGNLGVQTVEHCMAALVGLGIDNAILKVAGGTMGELPGGDGSSRVFVDALQKAQRVEQDAARNPLIIRQPVQVSHGEASIAALPGPTDHLEVIYDFEGPAPVGRQIITFRLGPDPRIGDDFVTQLSSARTFIFENEVAGLRALGLGKHLSPRDLLVIGPGGPIENKFRFPDECARHKVLDLIGDLFLVGRPVRGRIVAHKSGHELNHKLARKLLSMEQDASRMSLLKRDALLDIRKIQQILPHRYPMLLVDRVLEIQGDSNKAIGIKNVTFNDIFFQGHYPGTPIMPGVLIVEALAQLGGILLASKLEHTGKLAVLLSMDNVKMRHPVVPGDQLMLEAEAVRVKARTGHVRCKAYVGDKVATEAEIKFMLVDGDTATNA